MIDRAKRFIAWAWDGIRHLPSTLAAIPLAGSALFMPAEFWAEMQARAGAIGGFLREISMMGAIAFTLWRSNTPRDDTNKGPDNGNP